MTSGTPSHRNDRAGAGDEIHEFMMFDFAAGTDPDRQRLIVAAIDAHLGRCEGIVSRDYYRGDDGRWVKHLVWATKADLDASAQLDDDPEVAKLYDYFDTENVVYACCERVTSR